MLKKFDTFSKKEMKKMSCGILYSEPALLTRDVPNIRDTDKI